MQKQPKNGAEKALAFFDGNQSEMARALGVRQQSVSLWLKNGYIPWMRVRKVHAITGVPKAELNPKVYGDGVRTK